MTLKNNRARMLYYVKLCLSFQSHRRIQTWFTARKPSIRVKIGDFFCPAWPWKLMDDLEKQKGTSSVLLQILCVISNPLVNSNLSYSPETLNSGQNRDFLSCVILKFDEWPRKTIGHLFYAAGNAQFESKSKRFSAVWSLNMTVDLEKQ